MQKYHQYELPFKRRVHAPFNMKHANDNKDLDSTGILKSFLENFRFEDEGM